tara:strand:+ start:1043 stop:1495 length:453 start_codon:yes stop_codon:yes gene_type:complete
MKDSWKQWILDYSKDKEWKKRNHPNDKYFPKKYSFCTLDRNEVPFDTELDSYISSFIGHSNYINNEYVLIKYEVGDFIGKHYDDKGDNVITYICELQSSDCKSHLIIDEREIMETHYTRDVSHEVKEIQSGTRISLSMFGTKKISKKTIL